MRFDSAASPAADDAACCRLITEINGIDYRYKGRHGKRRRWRPPRREIYGDGYRALRQWRSALLERLNKRRFMPMAEGMSTRARRRNSFPWYYRPWRGDINRRENIEEIDGTYKFVRPAYGKAARGVARICELPAVARVMSHMRFGIDKFVSMPPGMV